ncbi:MAG: 5-(carboxyamino)imidazole ribonucleotide mutase [Archangium sp.]|nr:5-(carboxyamino)imidazole ribonucleotide mutase [Archangium sp.]
MSRIAVIMGSASDWDTLQHATITLDSFDVPWEAQVVSAHRTPELMFDFAKSAADEGFSAVIAGAGGAAHLPGMVASLTALPVLGVPVMSKALAGVDSLLSIVQMPAGVPTATFAIGPSGAVNAALFAIRMLAVNDAQLRVKLSAYREEQAQKARKSTGLLTMPAKPSAPAKAASKPAKKKKAR